MRSRHIRSRHKRTNSIWGGGEVQKILGYFVWGCMISCTKYAGCMGTIGYFVGVRLLGWGGRGYKYSVGRSETCGTITTGVAATAMTVNISRPLKFTCRMNAPGLMDDSQYTMGTSLPRYIGLLVDALAFLKCNDNAS